MPNPRPKEVPSAAPTQPHPAGSKGARAQEALLDAGLKLLGEVSPRELTAGTICMAAQMKRPSFYTYFDSVDDLLDAMIRREIYRLEALYEAPKDKDKNKTALHRIAGIPLSIVNIALRDKARVKSVVTLMAFDPRFTHFRMDNLRRDVEAAIAEGSLSLDANQIDVFMHIFVASILSLMARVADKDISQAEVKKALKILLSGAGADAAALNDVLEG